MCVPVPPPNSTRKTTRITTMTRAEVEVVAKTHRPHRIRPPGRDDQAGDGDDQEQEQRVGGAAGRGRQAERPEPPGTGMQRPRERPHVRRRRLGVVGRPPARRRHRPRRRPRRRSGTARATSRLRVGRRPISRRPAAGPTTCWCRRVSPSTRPGVVEVAVGVGVGVCLGRGLRGRRRGLARAVLVRRRRGRRPHVERRLHHRRRPVGRLVRWGAGPLPVNRQPSKPPDIDLVRSRRPCVL